jgi:hypothetical protein
MPINLKGRSILTLDELSPNEIRFLLGLAADLKTAKSAGIEQQRLKGRNIALILRRTRRARAPVSRWLPTIRRARHLPRPYWQPDRPQGIDEGYGARARPHL